jgi:hypothetical protein
MIESSTADAPWNLAGLLSTLEVRGVKANGVGKRAAMVAIGAAGHFAGRRSSRP